MRYIFSYVNDIERDLGDGRLTVHSEERDVNYPEKHRSVDVEKKGIYKFDGFVVVLYARRKVKEPRSGWCDLAYMLGKWHIEN